MTIRTNQLYGKVWGDPSNPATLTVNFNNEQVFSGTVPTTLKDFELPDIGQPVPWHSFTEADYDLLCSWHTDLDAVDSSSPDGLSVWRSANPLKIIPVSITITGGVFLLSNIKMNQFRTQYSATINDNAVWPKYVPSIEDLLTDNKTLSPTEFEEKYGLDKIQITENITLITSISIEDNFIIPFDGTDNKTNVKINNELQVKSPEILAQFPGNWKWFINNADTITFDNQINI